MTKKKSAGPPNKSVSSEIWKEIQACRPLRLFIKKQKKKGNESKPFAVRMVFLQTSPEKQLKYFQKAINKYIQILDDKEISEQVQTEGHLFENLLSKKEQRMYFESLDAPKKPPSTTAAYYNEYMKQEHTNNAKPWKSLSAEERKPYVRMLNDAKVEYAAQVKNFADNLPDRLKTEYLLYTSETPAASKDNGDTANAEPIKQRRKSVQPLPENFQPITNDSHQKLTRTELDELHKCQPSALYYEQKVPEDEKPTFANVLTRNAHIRSVFNQLSDKKRHKFLHKATKAWEEYLRQHPTVIENQIPTLHLLLSKNDDVHYYFNSLGLPPRPPATALILFNNERLQSGSQQSWLDLPQTTKDEYIRRLTKLKAEYHQKVVDFVENTLPSDYIRLEFFRNIKLASRDYEAAIKDRTNDKDEGQLKITQYLKPKERSGSQDVSEFDRIKQQLLATQLTNEQSKLVERLGQLMKTCVKETTLVKKNGPAAKSSTASAKAVLSHRASTNSSDVILVNGDVSADDAAPAPKKTKKKRKHDVEDVNEPPSNTFGGDQDTTSASSSSTKKRK